MAYGQGLYSVAAGQAAVFYVVPVDNNGNNITNCQSRFSAFIYNTTNNTIQYDCNNGLYSFHYQQRIAVTYTLKILYNGVDVAQSPYHPFVTAAPVYPPGSVGQGAGLQGGQVGQYSYFSIIDYDAYGNRNYSCNVGTWQARLTGASTINANVANCSNGISLLRYFATVSGPYDISVSLFSVNLQNSPFHIVLAPGPIDPTRIYPTGQGATNGTAGVYTTFKIVSVDEFGNFITSCTAQSSDFQVYLKYRNLIVNATFISCQAGLYSFSYNVTIAVAWQLFINFQGILSGSSPSSISIAPSNIIDGPNSQATGIGLTNGTAGVPAPFDVIPFDIFGNQIVTCPKSVNFSDWQIQVTGRYDSTLVCRGSIAGCTGGKFNGQYVCFNSTTYALNIFFQGIPIQSSPYYPYIQPGPIDGPRSPIHGSGLTEAYAGVPATFVIDSFDQYGNNIDTCLSPLNPTFDITVFATDIGVNVKGNITNCVGGNYTGQYIITRLSFLYILSINYQGNGVDQSPYSIVTYPGPPYLPSCKASGPGINSTVAGNSAPFQVTCSDQYGNAITQCFSSSYWNATLSGPSSLIAQLTSCNTNNGPAVWNFQYVAYIAGQYNLNVKFSLSSGSLNYFPTVYPAQFASGNSIAVGPGVTSQNIPAGSTTSFLILSRDQYGNNVTTCIASSDLNITIQVVSTGAYITPSILTCSFGRIPVSYSSTVAGTLVIKISYRGTPIENSPYYPRVVAGPPTGRCHATGSGLVSAVAGQPAFFTTSCSDNYGNPVLVCYPLSGWSVYLYGPSNITGSIVGCGNNSGIYSGQYTAYKSGNYTLNLGFQQTVVGGNPWHPSVAPGPLNDTNALAGGPGFNWGANIVAGSTTNLTVTSYDTYQNRITACTVPSNYWTVKLSVNGTSVTATSSSCSNGVYFASYSLQLAAKWTVNVSGRYAPVQNNPGYVNIIPGPLYAPNSDFTALQYVVAGQIDPILIKAYDQYRNPITECPPSSTLQNFFVRATLNQNPSVNFTGSIVTCNSGKITGYIQMNVTGNYSLTVKYSNTPLISSPLPVTVVTGYVSSQYTRARGQGVDPTAYIIAGRGTTFYIDLYNQYGVRIYDNSFCQPWMNWTVRFSPDISAYPSAKNISFGGCSAGSITVYYNATTAGYYTINIYSNSQQILGNPYHSNVYPTYLDPTKTVVFGLNNTFNTYANFSIIARDIFGNSVVNTSQNLFHVAIEPTCITKNLTCSPRGDVLLCRFWVWEGGRYCVTVYYQNTTVGLPDSDVLIYGGLACGFGGCVNGYCFAKNVNSTQYVCNCFQGYGSSDCSSKTSEQKFLLLPAVYQPISKLATSATSRQNSFTETIPKLALNNLSSVAAGGAFILTSILGFVSYYIYDKLTVVPNRLFSS